MQYIIFLLPLLAIFMMMRSQKKRQAQAQSMQSTLQPGAGVRTIGGMYALVKAVNDETVELEVAPGVVAHYTKGAIAAVLEPLEYDAIINGRPAEDASDEAAEAVEADAEEKPLSLSKDEAKADAEAPESK
ncbi:MULTISPECIES: preprotein translocase subunit YajC [Kitasatospora]|uniref:Putative preprotein translocase YajC subunit n=1 Tax=Kitasatospora setae (strain ATCC 33774 / DSM 43861 / JCM 3304 / KCC A-0304 / NBRC 14216 / KM-6054) TaxID=452652 RepID=E4N7T9_KITSK|nr:preprotein translocase subunit YajC [Kitasatospora setae]BAJ27270.1 putative preprotein translocase YajC subunit [Kitasatospora setae KM-6054]